MLRSKVHGIRNDCESLSNCKTLIALNKLTPFSEQAKSGIDAM